MSNHWWRAYDEAIDDAKLLLLPSDWHRWGWFRVMCLASANGGTVPPIDVVAVKLRASKHKCAELITTLVRSILLDEIEPGQFTPHNWNGRQYRNDTSDPTNADRQRRYRERHSNGHSNGVTPVTAKRPETETESSLAKAKGADAPSDPKAELFARARAVLGPKAGGGLTAKLLRSIGPEDDPKVIAKARSRIEEASTKAKPAEWLGRVMSPARPLTADGERYPEGII